MLSDKSRLQKDKYNMPPLTYMFKIHETLECIFMDAYTYIYIYAKPFLKSMDGEEYKFLQDAGYLHKDDL